MLQMTMEKQYFFLWLLDKFYILLSLFFLKTENLSSERKLLPLELASQRVADEPFVHCSIAKFVRSFIARRSAGSLFSRARSSDCFRKQCG